MSERRKSIRHRTFLGGRISVDKLPSFDVGCTVRNVSEGGARLTLEQDTLLPSSLRLGISGGDGRPGRLVWYRAGEVGVAFGDRQAADPPSLSAAGLPLLHVRMQAIMNRRAACGHFTRP